MMPRAHADPSAKRLGDPEKRRNNRDLRQLQGIEHRQIPDIVEPEDPEVLISSLRDPVQRSSAPACAAWWGWDQAFKVSLAAVPVDVPQTFVTKRFTGEARVREPGRAAS